MLPPELIHFTEGGPYHSYLSQDFSDLWIDEFKDLLAGNNPCAEICDNITADKLSLEIIYASSKSKAQI